MTIWARPLSGKLFITEGTEEPTLLSQILKDNPRRSTRTTFTAFTETNTGILYKATEQIGTNPVKDVYYFAGDAKNNWIKFGKTTEGSCTYKGKDVLFVNMTDQIQKYPENETECTSTNICDVNKNGLYAVGLTESECSGISGAKWTTEKATWNGTSTKDIYWRIIRTNADESIKLLYAGTSPDTTSGYIGTSKFNTKYNDPMYVGYKYGTTGSLENNRLNTNDITIKTYVDNWYKNNLISYTKYLSNDAVYCNDRSLGSGQTYSTTNDFAYASWERIDTNKQPTYNCTNMSDAFSVNNTSAKLDYPVGLMTIDELSYAGGESFNYYLNASYAWYHTNANGKSITGGAGSWALSPSYWLDSDLSVWVWGLSSPDGLIDLIRQSLDSGFVVRPVLSLKSCIKYSTGNGTPETPYEIVETDTSC